MMLFYFWNTIQIGHKLQRATITLIPSSYLDFYFPSAHCMMNLISSEILKKEITALPKQMAAVMNATAESHSEIPLMRNTINIQVAFLKVLSTLLGRTDFYMSQDFGNQTSNLTAAFLCYVYIC